MDKCIKQIKSILDDNDLSDYKIQYILKKEETLLGICCSRSDPEDIVKVTSECNNSTISKIPEWDYSIDQYLFSFLQEGFKIKYMPLSTHYGIWCNLADEEDIIYKKGLQLYINYFVEKVFNCYEIDD